jgi:hypothetical protein
MTVSVHFISGLFTTEQALRKSEKQSLFDP